MVVNIGPQLRAFLIVMIILATVALVLRFWSRAVSKTRRGQPKFWWDDWVALMSLPVTITSLSMGIYMISIGLGKHVENVSLADELKLLKVLFGLYFVYDLSITIPKCSALLFYARIFGSSSRLFVYSLWAIQFCIFAWLISIWGFTLFLCDPVRKQWLPSLPGHCHPTSALWLGSAIPSVIIDLVILFVPIPMLWQLQMKKLRKALIIGVFLCGYCVIVISLGRLITVVTTETAINEDLTFAGVKTIYWLGAEAPVTILSISLPSIFFLLRRVWRDGLISLFTSRNATTRARLMGHRNTDPSADEISRGKNGSSINHELEHELERHSFDSGKKILPLVPGGQEYQVYISKTPSSGSTNAQRFSEDQIRVRNEVRVDSEGTV